MEKASPLKCGYLRYVAIKFQGCRCIHFSILFHQEMAELAAKAEAKAVAAQDPVPLPEVWTRWTVDGGWSHGTFSWGRKSWSRTNLG